MYTPQFSINNKILRNIGAISAAREVIENAALLPAWEKKFQEEAAVRSVHYGTHIEGNELSMTQVEKVLDGESVVARARDVQEVINYRKVIDLIGEKHDEPVTLELIRMIHGAVVTGILDEGSTGLFRTKEVVIRNSATGDVVFRPPKAVEVEWQLNELVEFINGEGDIHPILKSGIVHYEFVRIHPFVDGNGRSGRALSMLVLFQNEYDIRRFFSLEEYFDRNPEEYYEALQSVESTGDQTVWLTYFTECVAAELSRVKERVERISRDVRFKKQLGGPVMLSERQIKLIEYINETGYIENKVYEKLFPMVSEDTVLREVQDLVKKGILRKQGKTKGVKYFLKE